MKIVDSIKISIITVVYNGANAIAQTIESVLTQDYDNLEYIIIDGNSTDGTQEIIRQYEDKIAYWVSEPDKGIYDAMNKGLSYATGDVIAFLNVGDWYEKDAIKNVSEWFRQNDSDILICGVNLTRKGRFVSKRIPEINSIAEKITTGMPCCHQGIFAKTKWLGKNRYFDLRYRIVADYDWLLGCYYAGACIVCTEVVVANYDTEGFSSKYVDVVEEEFHASSIERLQEAALTADRKNAIRDEIEQLYEDRTALRELKEYLADEEFDWKPLIPVPENAVCSVFGCGAVGEECCRLMKKLGVKVCCVWDNDPRNWGGWLQGCEICNPQNITHDKNVIVIASTRYEKEIETQLKQEFGIQDNQYILYSKIRKLIWQKRNMLKENGGKEKE